MADQQLCPETKEPVTYMNFFDMLNSMMLSGTTEGIEKTEGGRIDGFV